MLYSYSFNCIYTYVLVQVAESPSVCNHVVQGYQEIQKDKYMLQIEQIRLQHFSLFTYRSSMYSLLSQTFRLVKKFAEHVGYRRKPKLVKIWADLTMKILSATLGCVSAHVSSPWLRGDGDMQILFAIDQDQDCGEIYRHQMLQLKKY